MCIIVDVNVAMHVFTSSITDEFKPILDWLTLSSEDGVLLIGGKLTKELSINLDVRRFLVALSRAGRLRNIKDEDVEHEIQSISNQCQSNDTHIIALARMGGSRLLCSRDVTLHCDFCNPQLLAKPRGKIYQNPSHAHLLRTSGHTSACKHRLRH